MRPLRTHSQAMLATLLGAAFTFISPLAAAPVEPEGSAPVEVSGESTEATPLTFVETVTVTATSNPTPIQDVAGTVGRVERSQIEAQLMTNARDLLRFEPGVDVTGDPTRLGLGGFVIRGIGGNRVQTRVDGVPVAEDFAFGPLGMVRFTLDPDLLQSVEVVRSAGSSLYGSDALGGVISLVTRDPEHYLRDAAGHGFGGRLAQDGRSDTTAVSGYAAGRFGKWSASLALDGSSGHETKNQGKNSAPNSRRTAPNPSDRDSFGGLAKLFQRTNDRFDWRISAERYDAEAQTEVYSGRTFQNLGPVFGPGVTYTINTSNLDAVDTQERSRLSAQALAQLGGLADTLFLRAYGSTSETDQQVDELVVTSQGGGPFGPLRVVNVRRDGTFRVEEDLTGLELQARKSFNGDTDSLFTYGVSWERNSFDMLRNRLEFDAITGAARPATVLVPTKYFPASDVDTLGAYVQAEIDVVGGRLRLIPGVRYDRSELDPDANDQIFLSGNPGTPLPVEAEADALSPKLGVVFAATDRIALFAQYSGGFRTPPYSSVNNGFSNATSRYRTLPNPNLDPETSDNAELGARVSASRGSLSVTLFDNRYSDFIEQVAVGTSPIDGFLEYQYRNLTSVEIRGIELAGDQRFGDSWKLRGALAWIEGENRATELPLNSITPPKAVLGVDWAPPASPWDAGLIVTYVDAKSVSDIDRTSVAQFATPDATIVDLVAGFRIGERWSIRAALLNALDETYWNWTEVGGLSRISAVLDRYTAPGRSGSISLRFGR